MDHVSARIAALLERHLGLSAESVGARALDAAIHHRMRATRQDAAQSYHQILQTDPAELSRLSEALVVPETWFFRYVESFRHLAGWASARRAEFSPTSPLRILSIPCSTGEEPYSIAATLLAAGLPPDAFLVEAVDVSQCAIDFARTGTYAPGAFREPVDDGLARYLTPSKSVATIGPEVRKSVRFQTGNLIDPRFMAKEPPFHAIFCRNLFIYLTDAARQTAVATLDRLLVDTGYLYMGHAEQLGLITPKYRNVPPAQAFAFQRAPSGGSRSTILLPPLSSSDTVMVEVQPAAPPKSGNGTGVVKQPATHAASAVDKAKAPARSAPPSGSSTVTHPPQRVDMSGLLREASAFAGRGAVAEAVAICERVIREGSPKAEAFALLGVIHQMASHPAEAERCFSHALFLDPTNYDALIHMMALAQNRGDETAAAQFRRRAETAARREAKP